MLFKSMNDMINYFYGADNDVAKTDAPVLSSTTGVYNAVYGAAAFNQLNSEANVFAALPKYPWRKSGWRVITADAGSAAAGGVSEGGAIPDTIKPTFAEVAATPKEVVHSFEISTKMQRLAGTDDDTITGVETLRAYHADLHAKRINEMLCVDMNTLAGTGFESIDRVTGTAAENTALSYTSGDEDIYGIDRSASSWADAVCDHNSGTDRTLTMDLITSTLATLQGNGARTNLIITGTDTYWRIVEMADSQVRYQGVLQKDAMVQIGVNGVQTEEGINAGVRVATLFGIPIIKSQSVAQDTISRIYLLDTTEQAGTGVPRLGIAILAPTMYFETGMDAADNNPFVTGTLSSKGMYYTAGELVCTFFKGQGKIRDLK